MTRMTGDTPVPVPGSDREFSDVPYAGLFGDTVIARVVEEIIADPHSVYHPKDLEDLTENSAPRIREALVTLTKFGLLKSSGKKHPAYVVDKSKKTFVALTLLAYAVLDDKGTSDCMNTAIRHYSETTLNIDQGICAVAVSAPYRISDQKGITGSVHTVSTGNAYSYQTSKITEGSYETR
ncbi:MAG: hypothetical protein WC295_06420 [Methanoregula sp.]|nr:hypothetical protein [Methanoregula sp.]